MASVTADDPLAVRLTTAIQQGRTDDLAELLRTDPGVAGLWIIGADGTWRSPLHIATDYPGHFPAVADSVRQLLAAGADVEARVRNCRSHAETPLHWAASTDDVAVIDVLLDAGADIEADGAVIADRTAVTDAAAFGQWAAARRLVERGAHTIFWESATLGLSERVRADLAADTPPDADELTQALWGAAHGGQQAIAELLLDRGADPNWIGWDDLTALDAARRNGFHEVADWLEAHGGLPAAAARRRPGAAG